MFRFLSNIFHGREVNGYISKLRGMDGDEIGGVVALSTHMRNQFLNETDLDLFFPFETAIADPFLVSRLSRYAKKIQKKGLIGLINSAGILVWIHTLRATMNPDLRMKAREMWGELSRGFPYVEEGARLLEEMTGETLDLRGAGTYPDGFTPQPK